ncbi:MAG: DUF1080 domain-containing protein [Acidobacteria bacterium]|nr:DUF1080 domain-containing protein [Acidobacteriota bacterium]
MSPQVSRSYSETHARFSPHRVASCSCCRERRTLDGWVGSKISYKAEDGMLVFDPTAGDRSNLYTAREYDDFQLRFEFLLTPGANSGVGIRALPEPGGAVVRVGFGSWGLLEQVVERLAGTRLGRRHGRRTRFLFDARDGDELRTVVAGVLGTHACGDRFAALESRPGVERLALNAGAQVDTTVGAGTE